MNPAAGAPIGPIGLLGGSFDPVHCGHLQLASDALAQLALTQVRFIPAGRPWQKPELTQATHRARMLELAISRQPRFAIDTRELERPGPSYTVDTLLELRKQLGTAVPLVLLIGADQFARLDTWHEWPRLIELAHLAVAGREAPAPSLAPALERLRARHLRPPAAVSDQPAGALVDLAMTAVNCSSTQIRALLRQGLDGSDPRLAAWLSPAVLDYILQQGIYA